jgi:ferredoxin
MAAPEVFEIEDDKDVVTVINPEPTEELRKAVERAVLMCPTASLHVEG